LSKGTDDTADDIMFVDSVVTGGWSTARQHDGMAGDIIPCK